MDERIPQFHKNPNFRRFIVSVLIVSLLLALSLYGYHYYLDIKYDSASRSLIKSSLETYYDQFGYYPASLKTLEDQMLLKPIPKKSGGDFIYKGIEDNEGNITSYELD